MGVLGPFIDSGFNPHILNEYDFEVKKATKIRSLIKVETQLGQFAIRKVPLSYSQLERMKEVTNYLHQHKFSVNTVLPNKYGEYFIPVENGFVFLTKWIEGEELTLNHHSHLLMAVSMMAHMHQLGFSFTSEKNLNYPYLNELNLRNTWEKRLDWLKKYYVRLKRKTNSDVEQLLLNYIPFMIDWGEEAIQHLNQWIIEYQSIGNLRKTITHGKYHHRNIIISPKGKMKILDFEHVSLDTPVRDIAYFIRHYILNKENRFWVMEWLETYQKQVALQEPEKKLLGIFLTFPDRLIVLAKKQDQMLRTNTDHHHLLNKAQVRFSQMKEMIWFVDENHWLNK